MKFLIGSQFFIMMNILVMIFSSIQGMKEVDHTLIFRMKVSEQGLKTYGSGNTLASSDVSLEKIDRNRAMKKVIRAKSSVGNKDLNFVITVNRNSRKIAGFSVYKSEKYDLAFDKFEKKTDKERTIAIKKAREQKFEE